MNSDTDARPVSLDQKVERMRSILRELESVAVAFSAGVDSTLVLKVAIETLGSDNVVAATSAFRCRYGEKGAWYA